jgi:hypothetical protein
MKMYRHKKLRYTNNTRDLCSGRKHSDQFTFTCIYLHSTQKYKITHTITTKKIWWQVQQRTRSASTVLLCGQQ